MMHHDELDVILNLAWSNSWAECAYQGSIRAIVAAFPEQVWCPLALYLYFNDSLNNSEKTLERLASQRKNRKKHDLRWDNIYREVVRCRKLRLEKKKTRDRDRSSQDFKPTDINTALDICKSVISCSTLQSVPVLCPLSACETD